MVFESLVADLLNKYLGDYVENLDKSQLNIGIWGGLLIINNYNIRLVHNIYVIIIHDINYAVSCLFVVVCGVHSH